MSKKINRRKFLKDCSLITTGTFLAGSPALTSCQVQEKATKGTVVIDPEPQFEISPYFYMQFMEPLGSTDGSVDAAWDYDRDDWREDVIDTVKDLAPGTIRWGGAFVRYYKWREGVGPFKDRPPMYNYVWGGMETNRVGTYEFNDFCRRVGAEPLIAINLLSDGIKGYWKTIHGENRSGDAREAADWVSYANDPENRERLRHGHREPYNIKLWQLGNETSYVYDQGFTLDQACEKAFEYSKAMKERDPSIHIIGWGDVKDPEKLNPQTPKDDPDIQFWAGKMLERAGEYLDLISMHMMGIYPRNDTLITGFEYQKDPEAAWEKLLELSDVADFRIKAMKEELASAQSGIGIAVTEGHLSLQPYNANMILTEWLSAVYHARIMNTYLRHADRVKICTGADFCGTRWTVNAVMMPVPRGKSFLLPIGIIMRLYKRRGGNQGLRVESTPSGIDIAATRRGNTVCLHVLNTNFRSPVRTTIEVKGKKITGGRVFEIAPEDARAYVNQSRPDALDPVEKPLTGESNPGWTFPARSVSVVQLDLEE
ncbi:MAG: alpha-L-arabinofuranosidase [Candidatus Aminicenantes bacterium]|nr:alpha-L-arabinofuranosidase [Candidatus Aminicenantes bacterium]MDH5707359.1 alpha-L-arabinofuranosidase [Candidatus Aminicenantes bacterium]